MPRKQGSSTLEPGDPAPDFALPVAGSNVRAELRDFAGQWLLLVFLRHVW